MKSGWTRIAVLVGMKKDPFESFGFLHELHRRYALHPLYFFLVAQKTGIYDKNILPGKKAMRQLIQYHAKQYPVGLHPSWKSFKDPAVLTKEKNILEEIVQQKVTATRRHYIKMALPGTYRDLLMAGIKDDHSMGYGSINGFRASVASSYNWYDLSEEKITTLRVHPFCFMDANCYYEEKLSPDESYAQLMHYYTTCRDNGGTLITVFHNNFLGTDKRFKGWRELYTKFISQLP
ncbi:MAG: polysaccharide deacetylase family protein [Ferruginibacter sp.]